MVWTLLPALRCGKVRWFHGPGNRFNIPLTESPDADGLQRINEAYFPLFAKRDDLQAGVKVNQVFD
jgi:hypothetical protein